MGGFWGVVLSEDCRGGWVLIGKWAVGRLEDGWMGRRGEEGGGGGGRREEGGGEEEGWNSWNGGLGSSEEIDG